MFKKVNRIYIKILICISVVVIFLASIFSVSALGFDFDVVSKSVFIVVSGDITGYNVSLGSGFAIDENHIVTNAHVITDKYNIAIGCYSATEKNNIGDIYFAELVSIDKNIDIAILQVNETKLSPLKVADVATIKEGDDVYAIGAPEGLPYTLTKGTISSKLRESNGVKYVQTDTAINHGNSGGPLLNEKGEVVGVNTLKLSTSENIGFAIRMDFVMEYIYQNNIVLSNNSGTTSGQTQSTDSQYSNNSSVDSQEAENNTSSVTASNSTSSDNTSIGNTSSDNTDTGNTSSYYNENQYKGSYTDDYNNDYDGTYIVFIIVIAVGLFGGIIFVILKFVVFNGPKEDDFDIPIVQPDFVQNDVNTEGETNILVEPVQSPAPVTEKSNEYVNTAGIRMLSGMMKDAKISMADAQTIVIGKDAKFANLVIDRGYIKISRIHCSVTYNESMNKYFVVDSSSNGTYFENGTRLEKNTRTPVARRTILKLADDSCKILLM